MSKFEEAIQLYIQAQKYSSEANRCYTIAHSNSVAQYNEFIAKSDEFRIKSWKLYEQSNRLWSMELIRLFGFVPDFMREIENFIVNIEDFVPIYTKEN